MTTKEKTKKQPDNSGDNKTGSDSSLILHNDEVHSFDYVIKALVEICGHDYVQATQCTYIAHFKGKCDVKQGSFNSLKPFKDAFAERELKTTID